MNHVKVVLERTKSERVILAVLSICCHYGSEFQVCLGHDSAA